MAQLYGCCGVVVSFHACVDVEYQNKGVGTILNQLRKDLARDAGFSVILCTDKVRNTAQRKLLTKNGWDDILQFTNDKTGNLVALSTCVLNEEEPKK